MMVWISYLRDVADTSTISLRFSDIQRKNVLFQLGHKETGCVTTAYHVMT
jgi:hypothetical protein